jgi:hypothetical protein
MGHYMNKKLILSSLNKIANELDTNGLFKEANIITNTMIKVSQYFLDDTDQGKYSAIYSNILDALESGDRQEAQNLYNDGLQELTDPKFRQKLTNWWNYTSRNSNYSTRNNPQKSLNRNPVNTQQQNLPVQQLAQQWINQTSPTVNGDVMKLYQMAQQAKQQARNDAERMKYNQAMVILQSHKSFQK